MLKSHRPNNLHLSCTGISFTKLQWHWSRHWDLFGMPQSSCNSTLGSSLYQQNKIVAGVRGERRKYLPFLEGAPSVLLSSCSEQRFFYPLFFGDSVIRRISEVLCDEDLHLKTNFSQVFYPWYERSSSLQTLKKAAMDKLIKPYDKEYMRMAMLKHEETFKEQVYELHRLYQIQKILMKNMENSRSIELGQRGWTFKNAINMSQTNHHKSAQQKPQIKFDLERPADENIAESDGDGVLEIIDERKIELTLGPSSYNRTEKVETPLTSDSGHSFSSSSTGSSHINKTSSGNQRRSDTRREELSGGIVGLVQVPDSTSGYNQSEIRNNFDIEEQSRKERLKQPPWLFQVLSLNMT